MIHGLNARVLPAVLSAARAATLRDRFEQAGYSRYGLLDQGSYDYIDAPDISDSSSLLCELGKGRIERARVVRLRPGDYLLTRHDRVYDDRPTEIVLDLSAAPVAEAEVHWRHRGQVFFAMPSQPGAAAVVERGPTVMANHTYVSKRQSGSVVRLIAFLKSQVA